jgi:hypothetical protein
LLHGLAFGMPRKIRSTPPGFRKTSYELTERAWRALKDVTSKCDRDGFAAVPESAVLEALILSAKRDGVDPDVLDRVIRSRRAALDRVDKARRNS